MDGQKVALHPAHVPKGAGLLPISRLRGTNLALYERIRDHARIKRLLDYLMAGSARYTGL
jgi:hypothetical protein